MNFKFFALFILSLAGCAATNKSNEKLAGYNLSKPDLSLTLPDTLHEISGLTEINQSTIACIQDENGILFIYDILKNKIVDQFSFTIDGDYEGITRVGNTMYILRSEGTLFEIQDYTSPEYKVDSLTTGITAHNNEGLCYDPEHNRLLIASKGKIAKGPEFKDKRAIYGFDLRTKKLSENPVFDFDLRDIKQYATDHKIDVPTKTRKKDQVTEPFIKFMTSAIAVHPITNKLYLLSASDHLFFIINFNGEIEHMEPLDPLIFNKAEGITFLDNGDMIITNEGQDKKPTLLLFRYRN